MQSATKCPLCVPFVCIYLLCTYPAHSNCSINIRSHYYYIELVVELYEKEKNEISLILQQLLVHLSVWYVDFPSILTMQLG